MELGLAFMILFNSIVVEIRKVLVELDSKFLSLLSSLESKKKGSF